jgi:hypothetical protein
MSQTHVHVADYSSIVYFDWRALGSRCVLIVTVDSFDDSAVYATSNLYIGNRDELYGDVSGLEGTTHWIFLDTIL